MKKYHFTEKDLQLAAGLVRQSMVDSLPTHVPNEHAFSSEFEAKMQRVFKQEKAYRIRQAVARRVVAALLALLIGAVSWLSFDTQARASFFAWIRNVYENSIVYEFFTAQHEENDLPDYELGNLPEGLHLVEETKTKRRCSKFYADTTTGDSIVLQFSRSSEHVAVYVIEPGTPIQNKTVTIDEREFDICYSAHSGVINLSWYDEDVSLFFTISSTYDESINYDIIRSISLVDP